MDEINYWASKNMYISIFSIVHIGRVEWSVGIRIGTCDKNDWIQGDKECYFSSFLTYQEALEHAIDYCKKYKPKAIKNEPERKRKRT